VTKAGKTVSLRILVDSGAAAHTCPVSWQDHIPLAVAAPITMITAAGQCLQTKLR